MRFFIISSTHFFNLIQRKSNFSQKNLKSMENSKNSKNGKNSKKFNFFLIFPTSRFVGAHFILFYLHCFILSNWCRNLGKRFFILKILEISFFFFFLRILLDLQLKWVSWVMLCLDKLVKEFI